MKGDYMNSNPFVEDNRDSNIFTADYARKTLIVPEGNRVFGVKGDHYGRCFRCKLLNYPDTTVRFTDDTAVAYLQFENAAGETGSVKLKIEETTNRNDANKEGEAAALLSATIPNSLTKEAGTARLQLCGSYQADNGTMIHWHLSPAEVEIADFFDNEEIAESDPKYNLVEQAHAEINTLKGQVEDLRKALRTSLEDIKSALDGLDESNLPDSFVTQVTANRASIQALQQKITALENAGVDIDSLSETFATIEAVAAEYETKVHASTTYMRKDDPDYANAVNRVKNLENTYLSKTEASSTYLYKTEKPNIRFESELGSTRPNYLLPTDSEMLIIFTPTTAGETDDTIKFMTVSADPVAVGSFRVLWPFEEDGTGVLSVKRVSKRNGDEKLIVTATGAKLDAVQASGTAYTAPTHSVHVIDVPPTYKMYSLQATMGNAADFIGYR